MSKISTLLLGTATAGMLTILAACGGSDNNSPAQQSQAVPQTATASLGSDEVAAKELVGLLVTADTKAVQGNESYKRVNQLPLFGGVPTGAVPIGKALGTKRIDETIACSVIYPVNSQLATDTVTGCTGTIRFISDFDQYENAAVLPAGAFITITFNSLVLQTTGGPGSFSGSLTISLTAPSSFSGDNLDGNFRMSLSNFAGTSPDGESFGPETAVIDVSTSGGNINYVVNGNRISNLEITEGFNEDTYVINSGSMLTDHQGGYANVQFQSWNVVNGVPQLGSTVSVQGTNGSAIISVVGVSGQAVEFRVVLTVDGAQHTHTILATINGDQVIFG